MQTCATVSPNRPLYPGAHAIGQQWWCAPHAPYIRCNTFFQGVYSFVQGAFGPNAALQHQCTHNDHCRRPTSRHHQWRTDNRDYIRCFCLYKMVFDTQHRWHMGVSLSPCPWGEVWLCLHKRQRMKRGNMGVWLSTYTGRDTGQNDELKKGQFCLQKVHSNTQANDTP